MGQRRVNGMRGVLVRLRAVQHTQNKIKLARMEQEEKARQAEEEVKQTNEGEKK